MRKIAVILIVLAALFALVPSVFADGTVTVSGGSLGILPQNFIFTGVTLARVDHTINFTDFAAGNGVWEVRDPTGTGDGWRVTIQATDFDCLSGACTSDSGHDLPLVMTDKHNGVPSFFMRMVTNDVTWVDGQYGTGGTGSSGGSLMPQASTFTAGYTALDGTAQRYIFADLDEGMGTYQMDPDFQLFIPAEAYEGQYRSTLTMVISAGPGS